MKVNGRSLYKINAAQKTSKYMAHCYPALQHGHKLSAGGTQTKTVHCTERALAMETTSGTEVMAVLVCCVAVYHVSGFFVISDNG